MADVELAPCAPGAACLSPEDDILVCSASRGVVQVYEVGYEPLCEWTHPELSTPTGIVLNSHGHALVADGDRVLVFTFADDVFGSPTLKQTLGGRGVAEGEFDGAAGMAVTRSDRLVVADSGNSRIQIFDRRGEVQLSWGDDELTEPVDVAIARNGNFLVCDRREHAVFEYDETGVLLNRFGRGRGSESGKLEAPMGVAVCASTGRVAIADSGNHRIQVFDSEGRFLWLATAIDGVPLRAPAAVRVASDGDILVVDVSGARWLRPDADADADLAPEAAQLTPVFKTSPRERETDIHTQLLTKREYDARAASAAAAADLASAELELQQPPPLDVGSATASARAATARSNREQAPAPRKMARPLASAAGSVTELRRQYNDRIGVFARDKEQLRDAKSDVSSEISALQRERHDLMATLRDLEEKDRSTRDRLISLSSKATLAGLAPAAAAGDEGPVGPEEELLRIQDKGLDFQVMNQEIVKGQDELDEQASLLKREAKGLERQLRQLERRMETTPPLARQTLLQAQQELRKLRRDQADLQQTVDEQKSATRMSSEQAKREEHSLRSQLDEAYDEIGRVRADSLLWEQRLSHEEARCAPLELQLRKLQERLQQYDSGKELAKWAFRRFDRTATGQLEEDDAFEALSGLLQGQSGGAEEELERRMRQRKEECAGPLSLAEFTDLFLSCLAPVGQGGGSGGSSGLSSGRGGGRVVEDSDSEVEAPTGAGWGQGSGQDSGRGGGRAVEDSDSEVEAPTGAGWGQDSGSGRGSGQGSGQGSGRAVEDSDSEVEAPRQVRSPIGEGAQDSDSEEEVMTRPVRPSRPGRSPRAPAAEEEEDEEEAMTRPVRPSRPGRSPRAPTAEEEEEDEEDVMTRPVRPSRPGRSPRAPAAEEEEDDDVMTRPVRPSRPGRSPRAPAAEEEDEEEVLTRPVRPSRPGRSPRAPAAEEEEDDEN